MSSFYHVTTILRYYSDPLSPDGLRAVPEPGWCSLYVELRECGDQVGAQAHIEICDDCKAYMDRCEAIAAASAVSSQPGVKLPATLTKTARPAAYPPVEPGRPAGSVIRQNV